MELVLTLPVLLVLLMGMFEFSCLFFSYGSVVEASRAGARTATLNGVEHEAVMNAVHRSLGDYLFRHAEVQFDTEGASGDEVSCGVRVPMSACAPNLLWPIGFDIEGEFVQCATYMAKE